MKSTEITREEMWAKQHLSANEIDYAIWEQDKVVLQQMSKISRSCSFVVDVYKYRYALFFFFLFVYFFFLFALPTSLLL